MADCGPQTSIAPIENTGCITNPDAPEVQWTNRDETLPFINPRTCEYSIVVEQQQKLCIWECFLYILR